MTVTAAEFARFLSQSAEITRRQPVRLDEQTKGSGGFQYSESELVEIKGTSVGFSGASDGPLLEVKRPGQPPARPVAPDEIEQSEATEQEWSSHPGQLFAQITQQYSFAQQQLERELRQLGLEPDGDWCEVSFSNGLDGQIVAAFMSVVEAFREF